MAASLGGVLSFLRRIAPDGPAAEDGQLLSRFVQGDGGAFTALVGRYAPLVWGVCRRLLGASPDAEDAFQATFVVLVQKASSLADGRPLGPWLYKVASRTAAKAKASAAKRRNREERVAAGEATRDFAEVHHREMAAVLDEELGRLPERYRAPVVLCYLEGLTNEEAALRLSCPKGTILSRLSRAREQLRERLSRRGVDPAAILLPATLAPSAPPALVAAVAEAGPLLRAGGAGLSSTVMILAKGVVFGMFLRKLEVAGLVVVALALAASGATWMTQGKASPADEPPKAINKPAAKKDDKAATGESLASKLAAPIEFDGRPVDPRLTLGEFLDELSREYKVPIYINERAFKYEANGLEVRKAPIAATEPLPELGKTTLRRVLELALARVQVPSEATFLVRKDRVEITTGYFAHNELIAQKEDEESPFKVSMPPLVWKHFRKEPLSKALDELAESADANVLLDPRAVEEAKTPITARLMNVPLDTALRLITEMAGLSVIRVDNVFFVTKPEVAERLAAEKPEERLGLRQSSSSITPAPGGM